MGEIKFQTLKPGSVISLIAPARAVSEEEIEPFEKWVQKCGWKLKIEKHVFGRENQFSGSDAERAADFISAWTDHEVSAVITARGGYGCMRWLDMVPKGVWLQGAGKALIGFSDICTLHFHLNQLGFETIHGPMAFNTFHRNDFTHKNFDALRHLLEGNSAMWNLSENEIHKPADFEGVITGGNLSMIYAALGTPEQPDTNGKILFLEDLDEYLYHIDRMLVSMDRAGLLKNLKALLVGQMLDMKDNAIPFGKNTREIILERTQKYDYPVIFDFPAGHGEENACFKLNAYTKFDGFILYQPH
ncbi:MAG: LD-carboxypeptidase [Bacteroidetes bacterium]|nr:LD-carboxypeptidase [Bacteroidota bacterium]